MLNKDKAKLIELFKKYSPEEIMKNLSSIAIDTASDLSDDGFKDQSKNLTRFSMALDDLISNKPYLI